MSLRDEFTKTVQQVEELTARKRMWSPGVEWLGDSGTVTTDAVVGDPSWEAILRKWDLDPQEYQIIEPVLFNTWGGPDGLNNRQFKARVIRRIHAPVDYQELIKTAMRRKPKKNTYDGDETLIAVLADWQIGKADGDGLEGTIQRVLDTRLALVARVRALRKAGRPIRDLVVLWTGDSVEGCVGHYASQTFTVELDRRDQVKVTRRLLSDSLQAWAQHFDSILVGAVAGNHGENRKGGKAFTGVHDNDDLAIVEQVHEILSANPAAFGHVKFSIPKGSLSLTIPVGDWVVGISHGHVTPSGSGAEGKLRAWWEKQAAGRQPIGDADILVTGHYHHLRVADWGGCVWLQAPALDGGSDWWRAIMGEHSQAGMLTFVTTPRERVTDIAIL
jgi:predicted phosphodiesterase